MRHFRLPPLPYLQMVVCRLILSGDFRFPRRTHISIEGLHNLDSEEPMLLAMNHTDRFNYLPFMWELDQRGYPPVAPWVKGKYYQNRWLSEFLCWASCIPVPSRGFSAYSGLAGPYRSPAGQEGVPPTQAPGRRGLARPGPA